MEVRATALPEVKVLTPRRIGDARGWFCESWSAARLAAARARARLRAGQREPVGQGGHAARAALPGPALRPGEAGAGGRAARSATWRSTRGAARRAYGRWVAEELSAENGAQILVPRGFLHGFVTLADDTLVLYKVDNRYRRGERRRRALGRSRPRHRLGDRPRPPRSCRTRTRAAPAFRDWTSPFEYGVDA